MNTFTSHRFSRSLYISLLHSQITQRNGQGTRERKLSKISIER